MHTDEIQKKKRRTSFTKIRRRDEEKIPKADVVLVITDLNTGKEEYINQVPGKHTIHE